MHPGPRLVVATSAVLVACASISGLDQFTEGDCIGFCPEGADGSVSVGEGGGDDAGNDAGGSPAGDDSTADTQPAFDSPSTGPESSTGTDSGASETGDGAGAGGDGAGGEGDAGMDVAVRPCGPNTSNTCANGCCNSRGDCTTTSSASTCGGGGQSCIDCAASGMGCNQGACVAVSRDAGTSCNPNTCTNGCVPYFHQCCTMSNTCGCSLDFPVGPCM